ncbi:uncharacterized protein FA14DRAFT_160946 [Meira miltonrushii]|uniref:Uncharacterized protein n=1 Tax=Meira miltonrushii TaxID=1280837 RepID=A0A316VKK3_9BASI|nr:uncharacterized protein FA14DRAFT_160946 [Meira miltonrushii]PWN36045.1 hypothetical protein FA14DRAFT_160946 [Meira miltonrushii]
MLQNEHQLYHKQEWSALFMLIGRMSGFDRLRITCVYLTYFSVKEVENVMAISI